MKTVSLERRLVIGLLTLGYIEGQRTTHYRRFTKPGVATVFVGKAGALRYSRTGKVTQTGRCTDEFREHVLSQPAVPTHEHRGFLLRNP